MGLQKKWTLSQAQERVKELKEQTHYLSFMLSGAITDDGSYPVPGSELNKELTTLRDKKLRELNETEKAIQRTLEQDISVVVDYQD